jgi:outer membrane murein-binding lipoprotein Lpp
VIDFRYHLVSLISVFLALAVGIVLGAGPLRENLGDQLAGQVEQLRTEQEQLRTEAEQLSAQNDQLASFVTEIGPDLVDGTLEGKRVAVLTDDASTRTPVERITTLLDESGASQAVVIELQSALWEPGREQERADAVAAVREIAPAVLEEGDGEELTDSQRLSAMLPRLLAGEEGSDLDAALRSQLWQVLVDHSMVSVDGEVPAAVDAVIQASAAPEELADETEDDDAAAERAQGLLASRTSMLGTLAGTGLPAVVSAVTPDNDASTGILRTVRGEGTYDALSTTDRLQEPDGPVLAVLALVEQTRGGSGAYGTTADADDRLPALPETAEVASGGTEGGTSDGGADGAQTGEDGQGTGEGSDAASDGGGAE